MKWRCGIVAVIAAASVRAVPMSEQQLENERDREAFLKSAPTDAKKNAAIDKKNALLRAEKLVEHLIKDTHEQSPNSGRLDTVAARRALFRENPAEFHKRYVEGLLTQDAKGFVARPARLRGTVTRVVSDKLVLIVPDGKKAPVAIAGSGLAKLKKGAKTGFWIRSSTSSGKTSVKGLKTPVARYDLARSIPLAALLKDKGLAERVMTFLDNDEKQRRAAREQR